MIKSVIRRTRIPLGKFCLNLDQENILIGVEPTSDISLVSFPLKGIKTKTEFEVQVVYNLLSANYLLKDKGKGVYLPMDILKSLNGVVKVLNFMPDGWTETSVNFIFEEIHFVSTTYESGLKRGVLSFRNFFDEVAISKDSSPQEFFAIDRFVQGRLL